MRILSVLVFLFSSQVLAQSREADLAEANRLRDKATEYTRLADDAQKRMDFGSQYGPRTPTPQQRIQGSHDAKFVDVMRTAAEKAAKSAQELEARHNEGSGDRQPAGEGDSSPGSAPAQDSAPEVATSR